jgi:hypothetical protein
MVNNATVTLLLEHFDEMRDSDKRFLELMCGIRDCFEYSRIEPEECESCSDDKECYDCDVYDTAESLTVDVARLIKVTKKYALFGTDIEADTDTIIILRKETHNAVKKSQTN